MYTILILLKKVRLGWVNFTLGSLGEGGKFGIFWATGTCPDNNMIQWGVCMGRCKGKKVKWWDRSIETTVLITIKNYSNRVRYNGRIVAFCVYDRRGMSETDDKTNRTYANLSAAVSNNCYVGVCRPNCSYYAEKWNYHPYLFVRLWRPFALGKRTK